MTKNLKHGKFEGKNLHIPDQGKGKRLSSGPTRWGMVNEVSPDREPPWISEGTWWEGEPPGGKPLNSTNGRG